MRNVVMSLRLLVNSLIILSGLTSCAWAADGGDKKSVITDETGIAVIDDLGRELTLSSPARRVVSLAPHVTENLFSAGAGEQVVAVVAYSNYPEAARQLPSVGSFGKFNVEAILAQRPDLVVAWHSGNSQEKIQELIALGLPVYVSAPKQLDDVARNIENYGRLTANDARARAEAADYRQRLQSLRRDFSRQSPVSIFYQVWDQPLQTLNGKHIISDVMRLCGGRNVFADMLPIAPKVGVESVLASDPQVIVASGMADERPDWLDDWRRWSSLQAVKNDQLYFVPPDLVQRHTVRILQGAQMLCQQLQLARQVY